MSGKSNPKFWCGAMGVLLLLGGFGWFLYSKWALNEQKLEEMKQTYAQSGTPIERNRNAAVVAPAAAKESEHEEVGKLNITFRAVGLNRVSPGADQELAFNVLNEMKGSPYFDASNTKAVGEISSEVPLSEPPVEGKQGEPPGTFSFKIVAKLKRPLTL
jgi:hypothetical protein